MQVADSPLAGEEMEARGPSCPFCLSSWCCVLPALSPRSSDRRCRLCLWGVGDRVAPRWERGVRQLPGCHAISSVASCLHSFAFPSDLPLCPVFLMWFPLRSGWGKGSMWVIAVFTLTYHAKAWSALWYKGCRELQAVHKNGVWVLLTALIERQKSPSPNPPQDPDHLLLLLQAAL